MTIKITEEMMQSNSHDAFIKDQVDQLFQWSEEDHKLTVCDNGLKFNVKEDVNLFDPNNEGDITISEMSTGLVYTNADSGALCTAHEGGWTDSICASGGSYIEPTEEDLRKDEFFKFVKMLNGEESDIPFWETPAFEESDFQIIDSKIQFKDDILKDSRPKHITHFFHTFLKPMVDNYIANHPKEKEWPNGDGINDYERAMAFLK